MAKFEIRDEELDGLKDKVAIITGVLPPKLAMPSFSVILISFSRSLALRFISCAFLPLLGWWKSRVNMFLLLVAECQGFYK
jgi:hypothetical protein